MPRIQMPSNSTRLTIAVLAEYNATHLALLPPCEDNDYNWIAQPCNDQSEPCGPYGQSKDGPLEAMQNLFDVTCDDTGREPQ